MFVIGGFQTAVPESLQLPLNVLPPELAAE
jgi:hypothetical protein